MLNLFRKNEKKLNPGDIVICDDMTRLASKARDTRVVLSAEARLLNTLIVGPKGSGKTSEVILPMVAQDIQNPDWGMTILSSEDELPRKAFLLATEKGREALYFDPTTKNCPKFNPLAGLEVDVVENIVTAFETLNPDAPQFFRNLDEQLLRNAVKVLKRLDRAEGVEGKYATLINLRRLLQNSAGQGCEMVNAFSRIQTVAESEATENKEIAAWFINDYFSEGSKIYANTSGIRSQVTELISFDALRVALNPDFDMGEKNELDFEKALQAGTVLCITTCEWAFRDLSCYLANFIILAMKTALYRRRARNDRNIRPHALYIDEFKAPAQSCFGEILIGSQGLKVGTVMTIQALAVLSVGGRKEDRNFAEVVKANSRNIVLFPGINKEDAAYYVKEHFGNGQPSESDLIFAGFQNVHYSICEGPSEQQVLSLGKTRPLPAETYRKLDANAKKYEDDNSFPDY